MLRLLLPVRVPGEPGIAKAERVYWILPAARAVRMPRRPRLGPVPRSEATLAGTGPRWLLGWRPQKQRLVRPLAEPRTFLQAFFPAAPSQS